MRQMAVNLAGVELKNPVMTHPEPLVQGQSTARWSI